MRQQKKYKGPGSRLTSARDKKLTLLLINLLKCMVYR